VQRGAGIGERDIAGAVMERLQELHFAGLVGRTSSASAGAHNNAASTAAASLDRMDFPWN
jgi:hypothetical protein